MKENIDKRDEKTDYKINENNKNINLNKRKHRTGNRINSSLSKDEFQEKIIEFDNIRNKNRNDTSKYNKKQILFQISQNDGYGSAKNIKRNNSNISRKLKEKENVINIKYNYNKIFYNTGGRSYPNNINSQNELDNKILENNTNFKKYKKHSLLFLYTKHYGDRNKCPMCQSMEMKAKYIENKIGLNKKHICKDKDFINDELKLLNIWAIIKIFIIN